jgi:uncharacterized protein YegP (UPF0339 family)
MNKLNDFFVGLANKLPFAQQFFSRNVEIGPIELNTLFLILVGIVLFIVLVIIIASATKSGKKDKTAQPQNEEYSEKTAPAEQTKPALTAEKTLTAEKPVEKQPTKATEKPLEVQPTKATEKPVEKQPAKVAEPVEKQTVKVAVPVEPKQENAAEALAANDDTKRASGKFEIELKCDGYRFYLIANNGQLLFESMGYSTAKGAEKGIDTFKRAVENSNFVVDEDKFGRFRFILNRRYVGENYNTRAACESSIESVKNFSKTAAIIPYVYDEEAEKKYAADKNAVISTVDWEEVEKENAAKKPSGKFEIIKGADGYHYYLLANNGQLLFASNGYSSASYAKEAINNFKKAVYVGNFLIDEDKFGRFRFILRGAGFSTVYVGESYTTRAACEKIINSVKNFSRTAVIA